MLTTQQVCDWLKTQVTGIDILVGPYLPDMPDKLVLLTRVSGPGLSTENIFDAQGFHVAVRGNQRNVNDVEGFAWQVDAAIVDADYPLTISGSYVRDTGRTGGTPAAMPDPRGVDGERVTLTCTYYFVVGR